MKNKIVLLLCLISLCSCSSINTLKIEGNHEYIYSGLKDNYNENDEIEITTVKLPPNEKVVSVFYGDEELTPVTDEYFTKYNFKYSKEKQLKIEVGETTDFKILKDYLCIDDSFIDSISYVQYSKYSAQPNIPTRVYEYHEEQELKSFISSLFAPVIQDDHGPKYGEDFEKIVFFIDRYRYLTIELWDGFIVDNSSKVVADFSILPNYNRTFMTYENINTSTFLNKI